MTQTETYMRREAKEAGQVVATVLHQETETFAAIRSLFLEQKPRLVTTTARGSSRHATIFFKYLFEIIAGRPVAELGPSVTSVYGAALDLADSVHFTVSQSGASPDIVAMQAAARKGGAITIALVNVIESPLAQQADIVLPLHAGVEHSVAATKSCIAAAAALAAFVAHITRDDALLRGLDALPSALNAAIGRVPAGLVDRLAQTGSMFIAGRGPGLAVAMEAALKAKETCGIHAEAYSLAEIMHGPIRLVSQNFPIIAFLPDDAALETNRAAVERLRQLGADVITIGNSPEDVMAMPSTGHGLLDPLVGLSGYYDLIEQIARARGFNPDKPANLKKVTETM